MLVKIMNSPESEDGYRLIADVLVISFGWPKGKRTAIIARRGFGDEETIDLLGTMRVFIMNDDGKTIEKFGVPRDDLPY